MIDNSPRIVAIVQARLGSERFPRKVLAAIDGSSVLGHLLSRLRRVRNLDDIVLAVPDGDDELIRFGHSVGVRVVTGSESNVLARFLDAARDARADVVVRITADCPLIDPDIVEAAIQSYLDCPCDYLTVEDYPRGIGDVELVPTANLVRADGETEDRADREHVTPYFARHPELFDIRVIRATGSHHRPDLRVCVDEPEDLRAVRALIQRAGTREAIGVDAVIRIFDSEPDIRRINANVKQRDWQDVDRR